MPEYKTFSEIRTWMARILEQRRWEPAPLDGGSYVHQPEWERLGRACAELADKCNDNADATDDVDGEAWDYLVDKFNVARSWIYPNGLEHPATISDDVHRALVRECLTEANEYIV